MKWAWFNKLSEEEAVEQLLRCCGSRHWAIAMTKARPFEDFARLTGEADRIWSLLSRADRLEAFFHHPRIGDTAAAKGWASGEQSGVVGAGSEVLQALLRKNDEYEKKFGYLFLVCATGKTAAEMLVLLNERMNHDPEAEFRIACGEQAKITRLRLEKLLK